MFLPPLARVPLSTASLYAFVCVVSGINKMAAAVRNSQFALFVCGTVKLGLKQQQ